MKTEIILLSSQLKIRNSFGNIESSVGLIPIFTLTFIIGMFLPKINVAQEFGYSDFPANYNGITINMSTGGSQYSGAYQGTCNVNGGTKTNSIGLSSANMSITFSFSTAVNNIVITIGAINGGHKSVYTTNAGTVSISKISGDSQCGAIITGNTLTYSFSESYVDDRILVSSTAAYTSLTVTQPSDNTDHALYTLYMGEVASPQPSNPTSISATSSTICSGSSTQLTANGAQGTVYWYTASCGGTQVTTGNPVTVSPTTTTTYYARNYDNSQFSSGCASVTITVNPLLQYRSKAGLDYSSPRNWTTAANWEQYNGSSWVAATSYPGELSNACSSPLVTILTGHQMEISGVNITLPNLKIEGTGKLFVRSTAKLYVNGQLQLDQNSAGAIIIE